MPNLAVTLAEPAWRGGEERISSTRLARNFPEVERFREQRVEAVNFRELLR